MRALSRSWLNNAKAALANAPRMLDARNSLLARWRSAMPVMAMVRVPIMNPHCVALIIHPIAVASNPHNACRASAVLLPLNQSEVHSSSAMIIVMSGPTGRGGPRCAVLFAVNADIVVIDHCGL